jgi:hypothetical protein
MTCMMHCMTITLMTCLMVQRKLVTGDPHEWVSDRFAEDIGIDENLGISPMIMPVSEGGHAT